MQRCGTSRPGAKQIPSAAVQCGSRMFSVSEQGEIGMSFRGINTTVIQIRRQVFTEVARMAYANVKGEQANHLMRKIPYTHHPR